MLAGGGDAALSMSAACTESYPIAMKLSAEQYKLCALLVAAGAASARFAAGQACTLRTAEELHFATRSMQTLVRRSILN